MPNALIHDSPLAPGRSPVRIHYRDHGDGCPLLILHGGWGYEVYPFVGPLTHLRDQFRVLIPDRTGYGQSESIESLPEDFHERAAQETLRLLDALRIDAAFLWGHSDGAVIAAWLGLQAPARCRGLILEAFHFFGVKPRSRDFFESMIRNPKSVGARVAGILEQEHGPDRWRKILAMGGNAWLQIARSCASTGEDLYQGRLGGLKVPTLFVHGADDPRTEPGELERAAEIVREARVLKIPGAGHSPHSERGFESEVTRGVTRFLTDHADPDSGPGSR